MIGGKVCRRTSQADIGPDRWAPLAKSGSVLHFYWTLRVSSLSYLHTRMKTAGLILPLLLATTLPAPAQSNPPAAEAPAKLPAEVTQRLNDQLPKYLSPTPPKPEVAPDPDVLQLPKMTVTQKKRPRLTDQVMMTNKAFNEKLAKEKLTSVDRDVLNKFTLPAWFGGQSAADRAREDYDREQRAQFVSDVNRMAKVVEQTDPAQAKALRDAVSKP